MKSKIVDIHGHEYFVDAREVGFNGFEEFQFMIHEDIFGGIWKVSEKSSGFYIAYGKTPNETMKRAKRCLFEVGRRQIRGAIADAIKHNKEI